MRKSILRSTLLAVAIGGTSLAFAATAQQAAPANPAGNQPAQQQNQRTSLLDELGLTDKQKDSVRQLVQESMTQAQPEMQSLQQKRLTLEDATPGSSQYKAAANDLAQAESTVVRAQVLRQAELGTKIYGLLTAEQRTKFAALRAQRQQQMRQMEQQQRSGAQSPPASQ